MRSRPRPARKGGAVGSLRRAPRVEAVVVEHREGDAIFYDLTLEDPKVLAEPLVFPTRILRRNAGANAGLIPERGNCETTQETEGAASQIRH